jgi:hypothetical protein
MRSPNGVVAVIATVAAELNRRTIVLKKAGIAVGVATVALVALTPLAFADNKGDDSGNHIQIAPGIQDRVFQHPVKMCNEKHFESKKHNSDSHDGDCDQDISPDEDD